MVGSKVFQSALRTDTEHLKDLLRSSKNDDKKQGLKKVIAAMMLGRDMGAVFPEVTQCLHTEDVKVKKLTYLYLSENISSQPKRGVLCINTLRRDSQSPTALCRAWAIRTMGSIWNSSMLDYLLDPVITASSDKDPYVRRTAAFCLGKLLYYNADLCIQQGVKDALIKLLGSCSYTIPAALVSTGELENITGIDIVQSKSALFESVINTIPNTTEWGQLYCLEYIYENLHNTTMDTQLIASTINLRLGHENASVVMESAKILLKILPKLNDSAEYELRIKNALLTIFGMGDSTLQYVLVREFQLLSQIYPLLLSSSVSSFFPFHGDSLCLKEEKQKLLVCLANESNVQDIIRELEGNIFSNEHDLVKHSLSALGSIAIKLGHYEEKGTTVSNQVMKIYHELIKKLRSSNKKILQYLYIPIAEILSMYNSVSISAALEAVSIGGGENLALDSMRAYFWLLGEYIIEFPIALDKLISLSEDWESFDSQAQLYLLTALTKAYLRKSDNIEFSKSVKSIIQKAASSSDLELRDRGVFYWRLLSSDNIDTRNTLILLFNQKVLPPTLNIDEQSCITLVSYLNSFASVLHIVPKNYKPEKLDLKETVLTDDLENFNLLDVSTFSVEPVTTTNLDVNCGKGELVITAPSKDITIELISNQEGIVLESQPVSFRSNETKTVKLVVSEKCGSDIFPVDENNICMMFRTSDNCNYVSNIKTAVFLFKPNMPDVDKNVFRSSWQLLTDRYQKTVKIDLIRNEDFISSFQAQLEGLEITHAGQKENVDQTIISYHAANTIYNDDIVVWSVHYGLDYIEINIRNHSNFVRQCVAVMLRNILEELHH